MTSKAGNPYYVAILKGYNAVTFDFPRLKRAFGNRFIPAAFLVRDVMQLVLEYFDANPDLPQPANYRQPTIAEYFGIDTKCAHDALVDVRLCAAIHRKLRELNRKHL
jgi:DNA polymerase III epsilon subunit-like protein